MTARAVGSAVLLLCLFQACAFQVPVRRLQNRDLHEFRVPRATQLSRYMNQSVDPCTDFYEFACGNWHKFHAATEDKPINSPLEQLQDKVYKELQELLDERVTRYDGHVGRRVKDFYASCMDVEKVSRSVKQTFLNFVKLTGGMPAVDKRWNEHNYNWLIEISNLRKKFGMDIILGLEIKPDFQNQRDSRIYIQEPSTLIPKAQCKQSDFGDSQFKQLQSEVIDNMAYWFDVGEGEARKLAVEIFDFEITLCRGMSSTDDGLDVVNNLPRKALSELNTQFPSIDFQYFVTTSFGQPIPQTVYLQNEDYFTNLAKVMRTTSKRTVANYIMYRALAAMNFPDERDPKKRARLCIEKSMWYFPKVVGEIYHRKAFRTEVVDDVEQMWSKLREAFKVDLASQLWIEETTRRQAIYKLTGMQLKFPTYSRDVLQSEYSSLKIDKALFWENIQSLLDLQQRRQVRKLYYDGSARSSGTEVEAPDINVGYSPLQNIIRMSLGLMQPPVYHRSAPTAYKYAVLGFFIAHELVHGFDEVGWNYDETAAMRFWWDHNSTLLYKEQVKCFKDQYISSVGDDPSVPPSELDEQLRELIADNGALNISFNAYLMWLQKTVEPHILYDETLSDVDYTNTQLFFIAYAQNFCTSTYAEESPLGFFPWDVPNRVERFRVNGPLSNMKEFSREFHCPLGSDMNPADKCIIY